MKILKPGDPEKRIMAIQFKCQLCGCIFEADNSECELDSLYACEGRVDTYTVRCPNCKDECTRSFSYRM